MNRPAIGVAVLLLACCPELVGAAIPECTRTATIACGQDAVGEIPGFDPVVDCYTFVAEPGTHASITLFGAPGSKWSLYAGDEQLTLDCEADAFGEATCVASLPEGPFTIVVPAEFPLTTYVLSLDFVGTLPESQSDCREQIRCGDDLAGNIDGGATAYRFAAEHDEAVGIVVGGEVAVGWSAALYAPDGALVQACPEEGTGCASAGLVLNTGLPQDGTYTLLIRAAPFFGGPYGVSLEPTSELFDGEISCGEIVGCEEDRLGTLSADDGVHNYVFVAHVSEVVSITIASDDIFDALSWRLHAPDGTLVSTCTEDRCVVGPLPADGLYTILVRNYGSGSGEYTLSLEGLSQTLGGAPACGEFVECGGELQHDIALGIHADLYRFFAEPGDSFIVDLDVPDGVVSWTLYGPTASFVEECPSGTCVTDPLPDHGVYALLAGPYSLPHTASYSLSLEPTQGPCPLRPFCLPGELAMNAITPSRGGNTGSVMVTIRGCGFDEAAEIALSSLEQPTVAGVVSRVRNGETIACKFNLEGQPPGLRTLTVRNPDDSSAALPDAFEVVQGGTANVVLHLTGPSSVRAGRPTYYAATVKNAGVVDAEGPILIRVSAQQLNAGQGAFFEQVLYTTNLGAGATSAQAVGPIFFPSPPSCSAVDARVEVADLDEPCAELDCGALGELIARLEAWKAAKEAELQKVTRRIGDWIGELQECADKTELSEADKEKLNDLLEQLRSCAASACDRVVSLIRALLPDDWESDCGTAFRLLERDLLLKERLEGEIEGAIRDLERARSKFQECCASSDVAPQSSAKANSQATLDVCTIGSWDPNEKVGAAGAGDERYVSGSGAMPYIIFFENRADATAPAYQVVIEDVLDADLDLVTFAFGRMRIGDTDVEVPEGAQAFTATVDLRPGLDMLIAINARLDFPSRLATWELVALDPNTNEPPVDPSAGFLPPNLTPPEGEASVSFSAYPKSAVPTGTEIRNSATITFDTNPPFVTPEVLNTIDSDSPESHISSAVANGSDATVAWTGEDAGAGIRDFNVFVAEDGGAFALIAQETTGASTVFSVTPGRAYSLFTVARDRAGNVEPIPSVPDAFITVPDSECGDGAVSDGEECDDGDTAWLAGKYCTTDCRIVVCGDPDDSGASTASDALFVLRTAVGSNDCDACVCDADGNGTVAAGDALRVLKRAVGSELALTCQACSVADG